MILKEILNIIDDANIILINSGDDATEGVFTNVQEIPEIYHKCDVDNIIPYFTGNNVYLKVYLSLFYEGESDYISRDDVVNLVKGYIHEIITESGTDKNAHTNKVLKEIVNAISEREEI